MNRKTMDPRAFILSLASGASALVYQLVIIRNLRLYNGGTVLAVSTAIIGYLGGIALGSWLLGRLSDRFINRWRLYAIIEISIALSVLLWMMAGPAWALFAVKLNSMLFMLLMGLSLLPSTILMGGTLPVLARCLSRSPAGNDVRRLYTWNVFGAAAGCILASWWLIPGPGTRVSFLVAATVNVSIGIYSWVISLRDNAGASPVVDSTPMSGPPVPLHAGYLFAACLSGAGFLSAEVAWTRLLVNIASSSTLVVGTVIGGALIGIATGSWLASLRSLGKRPDHIIGWLFLAGAITLVASTFLLDVSTGVLARHVNSYPGGIPTASIIASLSCLVLLIAFFCTLLSLVFPVILQGITYQFQTLGGSVGRLLAANTLGGVLGVALTSLYGIPVLGAAGCLQFFALAYAVLAIPFSPDRSSRRPAILVVLFIALLIPFQRRQESGLWIHAGMTHFRLVEEKDILFRHDGREATTAVSRIDSHLALTVNGLIVAETSRPDLWDLLLKAHLPLLIHPGPDRVAVVGLGAGISLGAAASHADVSSIDCIEISPGVLAAHELFDIWNNSPVADPRVAIHLADGRTFLHSHPGTYDVITVDPVDPPVCNLYTREFYEVARSGLRPGGLMVQWVPLFRLTPGHFRSLLATYVAVFPEATLWYDGTSVLLVSHADRPLLVDPSLFLRRAKHKGVVSSLTQIDSPSGAMLLATFLCGPVQLQEFTRGAMVNTDDRPTLEYRAFLAGRGGTISQASNLDSVLSLTSEFPWSIGSEDVEFGYRSPQQLRSTLLQLAHARVARLRGKHEDADKIVQRIARQEHFTDADFRQLAPFHGGIDLSAP